MTVKIRAGWDEQSIVAQEITRIAEQAGATAITIHARTRQQAYQGPARWDWIKECKQVAKKILVIGNGDLHSPEDIDKMGEATGCDGFLVARGTMGQPWFIDDVRRLAKGEFVPRSAQERLEVLKSHFQEVVSYQNDRQSMIAMRRIGCWYLKETRNAKEIRHQIAHSSSLQQVKNLIDSLDREFIDDQVYACGC